MAETIASVSKACQLLKEAADMGLFSLSEMARALDEPTSSVDRLISTLAEAGFLERAPGQQWRIGKDCAALWASYCLALKQQIRQARAELASVHIPGSEVAEWEQ